jgi:hypothetical protein
MRRFLIVSKLLGLLVFPTNGFSPPSPHGSSQQMQLCMLEGAGDLVSAYSYCLEHHHLPTQSATGGVFSGVGDAIAQISSNRKENTQTESSSNTESQYDPKRTLHYFIKGLGGGIVWAYWYESADAWSLDLTHKVFPEVVTTTTLLLDGETVPTTTTLGVVEHYTNFEQAIRTVISIALEQFLAAPIVYSLWDIPVPALLKGSPPRQIPAQIEAKLSPLLMANAKLWTPVNIITYNIPLEFRLLFISMLEMVWQSILSGIVSEEVSVAEKVKVNEPVRGRRSTTQFANGK